MIRILTACLLTLHLASCSTTPSKIKLYSLSMPLATADNSENNKPFNPGTPILLVDSVKLAGYLSSRNLIMQLDDHQIYMATHHLWAEDLNKAIVSTLLRKLKPLEERFYLVDSSNRLKAAESYRLLLEFDAFHATDKSQVIASGKYWLLDNTEELLLVESFTYTLTQEHDGYTHTVERLNQSIGLLATDIIENINNTVKGTSIN